MATSREPVGPHSDTYIGRSPLPPSAPPQPGVPPGNPYGNYPRNNFDHQSQGAPSAFRFSPEELRVLQECNKESFYQRCLPLMSAFGLGTYYAMKSGYISGGNPLIGPMGKVAMAVAAGFVLGKVSYLGKYEAKILSLPDDSQLKQSILRKRVSGSGVADTLRDSLTMDPTFGQSVAPFGDGDAFSYNEQRSALDMDTSRPVDTFDDSFRIKQDPQEQELILPPVTSPSSLTYEELRRRNRESYESPLHSPYDNTRPPGYFDDRSSYQGSLQQPPYERSIQDPPLIGEPPLDRRYGQTSPAGLSPPSSYGFELDDKPVVGQPERKNQYGDLWEK